MTKLRLSNTLFHFSHFLKLFLYGFRSNFPSLIGLASQNMKYFICDVTIIKITFPFVDAP